MPLGKAAIAREGTDISLVTYAPTVLDALAVAEDRAKEGNQRRVIDLRTIAPYDEATGWPRSAKDRPRDHPARSGPLFGTGGRTAQPTSRKSVDDLKGPVRRIGGHSRRCPLPAIWNRRGYRKSRTLSHRSRQSVGKL